MIRTPGIVQRMLPGLVWRIPNDADQVYLTFDDGPTPEVTPWVLQQLSDHQAKATFFCIGKNVREQAEIFSSLGSEGHQVANHTNDHCNGWRVGEEDYMRSVKNCSSVISSRLFRPPYGKLTPGLCMALRKSFDVIMWDVLSGDFDERMSGEQCAANVINHVRPGSIVVFHDSKKAWPRLQVALPLVLEHLKKKNWRSASLEPGPR